MDWLREFDENPENNREHNDLGNALEEVGKWEVPATRSTDEMWQDLRSKLPAERTAPVRKIGATRKILKVAASILVLLGLAGIIGYQLGDKQIRTVRGEHLSLELPDGSEVMLDAASTVSFNRAAWPLARKVNLSGRAFFKVENGRSFVVNTSMGTVKVLGTEFVVDERENHFEVFCDEGKVEVHYGGNSEIITAGEKLRAQGRNAALSKIEPADELGWIEGRLSFYEEDLRHVLRVLEVELDVEVIGDVPKDRFFTGEISTNDPQEAVKTVLEPLGLRYSLKEDSLLLEGVK